MSSILVPQLTPQELQLLSNYSLIPPPPGVTPNFTNPESDGKHQIVVTSLLLCITATFILNRIYMKIFIVRKFLWDDLTVLLGMIGNVAYYAVITLAVQKGKVGVHTWNINIPQAASMDLEIPTYLNSVLTSPTLLFIKITFFIMYRQVFGPMRWMRISASLGAIFTALFYTSMAICMLVFATPRRNETWFSHLASPLEGLIFKFAVPIASVGLVIDLYILFLPIIAVTKLQMATRRKIGIILMFMTGILACLASILSIYYRVKLVRTADSSWDEPTVSTVNVVEMSAGIICACMPAASHTWHHHLPSYESFKSTLRSRSKGSSGLKLHGTDQTSPSFSENRSHGVKTPRGVHEGYVNLGGLEHDLSVPTKSLQTSIHGGRPDHLSYDGINQTFEMHQTSASPPHSRGWAAV